MRNERWMAFHLSVLTFVVVAIAAALIVEGLGFALIVALALAIVLAIGYPLLVILAESKVGVPPRRRP
jgi:predicted membrane metal-binding protein